MEYTECFLKGKICPSVTARGIPEEIHGDISARIPVDIFLEECLKKYQEEFLEELLKVLLEPCLIQS